MPVLAWDHGAQVVDDDGHTDAWAAVVGQAAAGIDAVELSSGKAGKRVAVTSPWGHFAIVMPTTPNASLSLTAFRADGTSCVHQMDAAHDPLAGLPPDALVAYAIGTSQAGIATAAEVGQVMTDAERAYGKQLREP